MSDFNEISQTKVHEMCSHCNTCHPKNFLCHGARELLDIKKSCDFCGARHSNLNTHFAEYAIVHLHDCLDKIYESEQRHICEQKVKSMVVKKHSDICSMCVEQLFPNDEIIHEDVEDVECIELLHQTRTCHHFCFYCFIDGDNLQRHDWSQCPLPYDTKYCIDDGI